MQMESMIERVAAAVADAAGSDFKTLPSSNGPGYGLRNMYLNMARAAIKATREPTEAMKGATYMRDWEALEIWQAMVDAALKEQG